MYARRIARTLKEDPKSVLLLGPRQTGKSTLMRSLSPDLEINLVREGEFLKFARNPNELNQRLAAMTAEARTRTIFIDEIQRLPSLLNTIQAILDERGAAFRFLLTGSSARKLKRGNANLLPGRIHSYSLGTLTSGELGRRMDTERALTTGTLPGIYSEENERVRQKTLRTYAATYLREEIQAESLARSLEGFSRFLFAAAAQSGGFLDFSKLASAAGIARTSAMRYFEILEETLIVRRIEAFSKSAHRRLSLHPKFYFFDVGVFNGLLENFTPSADRIGALFETLVCCQIFDSAAAIDEPIRVSTFRSAGGAEVDFIVELQGKTWAIEAKASADIGRNDLRGLKQLASFARERELRLLVLYLGRTRKIVDDVLVVPWQEGLEEIGL